MKRVFIAIICFLCTFSVRAGEGMWLPFLLEQINYSEMRDMGLKISAEDIYSVRKGSLKDAIVVFGGGCTGEVISSTGLVLTNHHCGYGTVNRLSSVEHDYLTGGFFAKSREEEIPCPGLSVTFIRNIEPVTKEVFSGVLSGMDIKLRDSILEGNIEKLEKEAKEKTGYDAMVKSFFYGNEYYIFYTEKFSDIRLVAFPPNGIGKFGGDTDNWAWPRHTGDFGLFRIYANEGNEAADYSENNKPYRPKRHLTINIGGIEEGDFTMVYGFPGRTTEYLTSDGMQETMRVLDPARIALREKRLNIMESYMEKSKEDFIRYASKQAGIANYYKKWKGELLGLQINDAVRKKQEEEQAFMDWVDKKTERRLKYGYVIDSIRAGYIRQERPYLQYEYIRESLRASDLIMNGALLKEIIELCNADTNMDKLKTYPARLQKQMGGINKKADREMTEALYGMYRDEFGTHDLISPGQIDKIYTASVLCGDSTQWYDLLLSGNMKNVRQVLLDDPVFRTYSYVDSLYENRLVFLKGNMGSLNEFYKIYMQGLREYSRKDLYPDANFTLRLTYGRAEGVDAQDGTRYTLYTTLDGVVKKADPHVEEFNMPSSLLDIYNRKDYGPYAITHQGKVTVPVAFLASNHTTGGNSGSPVLNGYGELIGLNFDRIWEGTMSDLMYDIHLCRNISVDIRYVLFIIEKFGNAKWIVDEMNVVGKH